MENKDKHTIKNYPFLKEMIKDNWEVNQFNKHILIASYELGYNKAINKILKEYKKKFYLHGKDIHPPYEEIDYPVVNASMIDEFKELKRKADLINSKCTVELFKILYKAFKLGKKIYGNKFTIYQLSKDFDISQATANRVLCLRRANQRTLKLIEENKIGSHKVSHILNRKSSVYQDEIIDLVIKNNLNVEDIFKLKNGSKEEYLSLMHDRAMKEGYTRRTSAFRYFNKSLYRIKSALMIKINDIPKERHNEIKNELIVISRLINNYINEMKHEK